MSYEAAPRVDYAEIERRIGQREPYTHASSCAVMSVGGVYQVYSYAELILAVSANTGEILFWQPRKFSRTTSKLQNIIRRVYPEVESEQS